MIALLTLSALVSYCLIILIRNENKHIYLRDHKGRFSAKVTKHTARKFRTVCDIRREVGLKPYGN